MRVHKAGVFVSVQANESRLATRGLIDDQQQLMQSLSNATNTSSWALESARTQQSVTDDLLTTVNASRRLADDAINNAERTLTEAEQTLNTLRGQSVQPSR